MFNKSKTNGTLNNEFDLNSSFIVYTSVTKMVKLI